MNRFQFFFPLGLLIIVVSASASVAPAQIVIIGDSLVPKNWVASTISAYSGDWYQDLRGFDAVANKYFELQFGDDGKYYLGGFSGLSTKLNAISGSGLASAIANEARKIKIAFEGSWKDGQMFARKKRSSADVCFDIHRLFSIFELIIKSENVNLRKIKGIVNRSISKHIGALVIDLASSWNSANPGDKTNGLWKINALRLMSRATWGSQKLINENFNRIVQIVDSEMIKRVRNFYCIPQFAFHEEACVAANQGVISNSIDEIDLLILTNPTGLDMREPLKFIANQYLKIFGTEWYLLIQKWIEIAEILGHQFPADTVRITSENSFLSGAVCAGSPLSDQQEIGDSIFNSVGKIFTIGSTFVGYNSLEVEMHTDRNSCDAASNSVNGLITILKKGFECIQSEQEEGNCSTRMSIISKTIAQRTQ